MINLVTPYKMFKLTPDGRTIIKSKCAHDSIMVDLDIELFVIVLELTRKAACVLTNLPIPVNP